MRIPSIACSVLAALFLVVGGCSSDNDEFDFFEAELSGGNEVPPRSTAASGRAGFAFDGTNLVYSIEVDDISNVIFAHIHSGAAGVNGPVRVFLFCSPGATCSFSTTDQTTMVSGTLTAANMVPGGITFEQMLAEMQAGTAYVNVHTTQFPGGEIRGQIAVED
jgi:hypothetical protein